MKKIIFAIIFLAFTSSDALAMNSASYRIDADSVNSGGGLSSSVNYGTFDSIGESFIGNMNSATYRLGLGFEPMITYGITLVLDSSTKNLGSLTPGTSITGTSVATVTTDAWGGYDLLISQNNNLRHTDAVTVIPSYSGTIAVPTTWSGTGFGFTVSAGTGVNIKWGTNPTYKYAAITGVDTIFHTKTGYSSGGDNTTVQYKVDVSSTQKSGTYSNTLTYTAISKL